MDTLQRADRGLTHFFKMLTMSAADRANSVNRGLVEYNPCEVRAFFEPSQGVFNAVISGGEQNLRISAMVAQAVCAFKNNFPVIVLHESNQELGQQLKKFFSRTGNYYEISPLTPCFEPFYGLNSLEIANQIIETATKDYDVKVNMRYYIDGISSIIKAKKHNLSFKLFSTCPHAIIFDKIDELQLQGKISDNDAQEIKSKVMMGQSENYKLDAFLTSLRMEIEPLMYVNKQGLKPVNVVSTLKKHSVLCFDIASVTNKLLLNTIVYQLKLALTKGIRYGIIIDSIPISSNEMYASYLRSLSDNICKTIVSDDFYSMVGGDEKTFSSLIGSSQILIVMSHTSGHSATKWAETFGQYDKYEESYSKSKGANKSTPFSILPSPTYSHSVSTRLKREYIVKPEAITRMRNGEAYVLSMARGELAHLFLKEDQ